MRQGLSFLILSFLFSLPLFSQSNGNEWIDYDQIYYRIKISQDGIYRIEKNALLNAGFPVDIDPRRIQLFAKEKELAIYIEGENDGIFHDDDFIEFLAYHNNGWLDSLLYDESEHLLNPYFSLYNDTLFYYLSYTDEFELTNYRSVNVVDQNFDGYSSSDYCLQTNILNYNNSYNAGKRNPSIGITEPRYLDGEGYGKIIISNTETINFNTENRYVGSGAPEAVLTSRFASANYPAPQNSSGNHHFQVAIDNNVHFDSTFFGYQTFSLNENIDVSSLSNTTQIAVRTVNDIGISNDRLAIGFVQFTFPHNFNLEGNSRFNFQAKTNSNQKLKIQIENFSGTNPIVYAHGNGNYRGKAYNNNDDFRFLVPQNGEEYLACYISASEEIQNITNIQKVSQSGYFNNFQSLNLTNAFLLISHPSLMEGAANYRDYRSQNFSTLLIDIYELYDQYGGGVSKHPLAIKRFIKDLIENWDEKPTNLFLIGKSISPINARTSISNFTINLVPTIGYPPSDNLLSAGLNGTELEPAIPTGRLSAKNNEEVIDYLNKMMLFETQLPDMWMKNTLHFGGGATSNEQSTFANYLSSYENISEDTSMGAIVYTYLKNTSTPIEIVVNEQITQLINGGVSLMTFFGHANGSGFDINIDQPENYDNYGKYPLILASSCYTGNIHSTGISNSEKFVLIPEKGSIAYLATVNTGIASYLNLFNQKFYTHNFQSHYNSSIGENIIRAIQDVPDSPIFPFIKESTCLEMTLHGDPSIILNAFEKPDFVVNESEVFFEPEILTADIDSFDVSVVLKNIARATQQSFNVELIRHFPGVLGDSIYTKEVNGLLNYDTLTFTLAAHHPFSDGLNTFDVLVDISASNVDELDNLGNNVIYGKEYIIHSGQIVPIYPYDKSIIDTNSPIFSGYAGSLDSNLENYYFQLSSESDFTSLLEEGQVNEEDGVIIWNPLTSLQNNSVYYWRTALESDANEGNWRTFSFEYIIDSTGWGQSTTYQFNENEFELLEYSAEDNTLQFTQGSKTLKCQLYGSRHVIGNEVLLDLNLVDYGGCNGGPYMFVMVFDPNTLEAWGNNYGGANPDHDFGNITGCRPRVEKFFAFNQNSQEQLESLYNMLNDEIPTGYHVLFYTYSIANFEYWTSYKPELFTLLSDWGSTEINVNSINNPFIFYTQKNNIAVTEELMGTHSHDTLVLEVGLPILGNSGKIRLDNMGKTSFLSSAQWEFNGEEQEDHFLFTIDQDNSSSPLYASSITNNSEVINSSTNSSLLLKGEIQLSDSLNHSPLQFEDIRLFYDPPGDAAINANHAFTFAIDSINEGENLQMIIGITNPTPYAMDSLLTRVSIVDAGNTLKKMLEKRLDSLGAFQSIIDTISIESFGLSGFNKLQYEINPLDGMGIEDQIEQNRYNNKISLQFYVRNDLTQPIVDVTFDGMHIMNGEIITPEPQIVVQLKDNSEYLVFSDISDTTNLSIFIKSPTGNLEKVNYSNPNLQFEFGTAENNQMRVIYRPTFNEDGKYLLLVQAVDKSGNSTGSRDYEIEFEIIRKAAITQVLNYPNPFVNKTHFVFTLTGTRVPDVFTIRIYTATGKIVKEIHKQELGTLRIGNNITDYYWDGKDNYGDQLANGVYFYKVDISYNDEDLESIESAADQYFKQGMGKMYLMR